jgi:hypothetical protein
MKQNYFCLGVSENKKPDTLLKKGPAFLFGLSPRQSLGDSLCRIQWFQQGYYYHRTRRGFHKPIYTQAFFECIPLHSWRSLRRAPLVPQD